VSESPDVRCLGRRPRCVAEVFTPQPPTDRNKTAVTNRPKSVAMSLAIAISLPFRETAQDMPDQSVANPLPILETISRGSARVVRGPLTKRGLLPVLVRISARRAGSDCCHGVGHVGPSLASHRTKAYGLWQRLSRAAGFGEALYDLFSVPGGGVPECDPTVEINSIECSGCRIALSPPRIGQVLLWRVRDGARREEESDREDRSDTLEDMAALVEHGYSRAARRERSPHAGRGGNAPA